MAVVLAIGAIWLLPGLQDASLSDEERFARNRRAAQEKYER